MIPNLLNPLPDKDRSAILKWLFRQTPQTVLLFMIVIGGGVSALIQFPAVVDNAVSRLEKQFALVTTAYDKDQERDERRYQAQQRFLEEFVRGRNRLGDGRQPIVKHNAPAPAAPF